MVSYSPERSSASRPGSATASAASGSSVASAFCRASPLSSPAQPSAVPTALANDGPRGIAGTSSTAAWAHASGFCAIANAASIDSIARGRLSAGSSGSAAR